MLLKYLISLLSNYAANSVAFLLELIKVISIGLNTLVSVAMKILYQNSSSKNGVVWMS